MPESAIRIVDWAAGRILELVAAEPPLSSPQEIEMGGVWARIGALGLDSESPFKVYADFKKIDTGEGCHLSIEKHSLVHKHEQKVLKKNSDWSQHTGHHKKWLKFHREEFGKRILYSPRYKVQDFSCQVMVYLIQAGILNVSESVDAFREYLRSKYTKKMAAKNKPVYWQFDRAILREILTGTVNSYVTAINPWSFHKYVIVSCRGRRADENYKLSTFGYCPKWKRYRKPKKSRSRMLMRREIISCYMLERKASKETARKWLYRELKDKSLDTILRDMTKRSQDREIMYWLKRGLPVGETSRRVGCTRSRVERLQRNVGLVKPAKIPPEEIDGIVPPPGFRGPYQYWKMLDRICGHRFPTEEAAFTENEAADALRDWALEMERSPSERDE